MTYRPLSSLNSPSTLLSSPFKSQMDCNQRCLQVVGLADLNHQNHWEDCLTSIAVVTATMAFWQHRKDYSSYLLVSLKALPRYFAASEQNGHSSPSKVITSP